MSKRDREQNYQGWFDPEDAYEKTVIQAFEHLQDKFGLTVKQTLAESVLFAARAEGFAPAGHVGDNQVERLAGMLDRLMGMIENGSFVPTSEAARQSFDEDTVAFDAISASVGSRYRPLSFEDEE